MDECRVMQIKQNLQLSYSIENLEMIYKENDTDEWSDEAFEAIRRILSETGLDPDSLRQEKSMEADLRLEEWQCALCQQSAPGIRIADLGKLALLDWKKVERIAGRKIGSFSRKKGYPLIFQCSDCGEFVCIPCLRSQKGKGEKPKQGGLICPMCQKAFKDQARLLYFAALDDRKNPSAIAGKINQMRLPHALFSPSEYWPFMLGIFLLGGLILFPLIYGVMLLHMKYTEALEQSIFSCLLYLIAFRRNGTIAWTRFWIALIIIVINFIRFRTETGSAVFIAVGFLGFLMAFLCGYAGIWVARLGRNIAQKKQS